MDYTERYIHAVISHLPLSQRADIKAELESLIADMLEERLVAGENREQAIDKILRSLGAPDTFAEQYDAKPRYLIGPNLFDLYKTILKIVIVASVIGMTISFGIQLGLAIDERSFPFGNYIASIFSVALESFAWVTIIFALIQKSNIITSEWNHSNKQWEPSMLPPLVHERLKIKPSSAIIAIIVQVFAFALFTFSPAYIGAFLKVEGQLNWELVPFLNIDVFKTYLPFIWITIFYAIVLEIIKMIRGQWTTGIFVAHAIWSLISLAVGIALFSHPSIWNGQFIAQLAQTPLFEHTEANIIFATTIWDNTRIWVIPTIILITVIDLGSLVYKFVTFRKQKSS
ncbi:permease prefix domain 1-containing protein [Paenibacillus yanchengensis]|uniref:Permease prefix domain 1-containing protein n=1 Tax=Paenibacillus yanchengensis TaxID=2035833 RepID=A0ABW4YNV6_9BACL